MREEISFGRWLRKQRRALDLSRQAFADQVGCAEVTVRRIEAGTLKPSKQLASILLEKLGMPETDRPQWVSFARGLSGSPLQPIPSSSQPITNLPAQITTFIGRQKEQSEVIRLISKHRLVTLTGSGGVGKTRLSIKVGEQVLENYADGVWLLELASLSDPTLLSQTTAALFGIKNQSNIPFTDLLVNFMRAKSLLLILDNCEHLLDACVHFSDVLLKSCSLLRILVTSREPLGIAGEAIYRVPSLGIPNIRELLDTFRNFESVLLFEERAQLVQFDFSLTTENAPFVSQICQRLDGIPLAIELAAAKVGLMSTEKIAKQLDENFSLLIGGSRTALQRHQTMRAAIEWSYKLLPPAEQVLFRSLSVFIGGWTLEAAEAVCGDQLTALRAASGPMRSEDVRSLMEQLINKSLVIMEELQGEFRYRMLETIRQYATDKLLESGATAEARNHHLNYFLEFAEIANQKLLGAERQWLNLLEFEHDNIRSALRWALQNRPEAALRLVGFMELLWLRRGYFAEGQNWCQMSLAQAKDLPHDGGDIDRARVEALRILATTLLRYDYNTAHIAAKDSVALARKVGDARVLARALNTSALLFINQGDHKAGWITAEESVALARQIGDTVTLAWALQSLGFSSFYLGDITKAFDSLHECEVIARQMEYKSRLMLVLRQLAGIMGELDEQKAEEQIQAYLEESLALSHELGETTVIIDFEGDLALTALSHGNLDEARIRIERVSAFYREMGDAHTLNQFQSEVAHTWRRLGNFKEAVAIYRETILFWQEIGHRGAVPHQLECFAFIAKAQEEKEPAIRLLSAAEVLREFSDSHMTSSERAEYEREAAELRAGMDESIFASLWAEGRGMAMDQAIEFALRQTDD